MLTSSLLLMASLFSKPAVTTAPVVEDLRKQLATAGFDAIFLDYDPDEENTTGRNWESELYSALQRADAEFVATSHP